MLPVSVEYKEMCHFHTLSKFIQSNLISGQNSDGILDQENKLLTVCM